jgi:hypothetical protein
MSMQGFLISGLIFHLIRSGIAWRAFSWFWIAVFVAGALGQVLLGLQWVWLHYLDLVARVMTALHINLPHYTITISEDDLSLVVAAIVYGGFLFFRIKEWSRG